MNKQLSKLALALGAVVMAGGAMAQTSATSAAVTASARIITPLTITPTGTLNFGRIANSLAGGTVVLSPANVPTTTGVTLVAGETSVPTFTVNGEGAATFSVTMPTSVTLNAGEDSMTLDDFQNNVGTDPANAAVGTLSGSDGGAGTKAFQVGATLNVGGNQKPAVYSGTFTVTVAYN